MTGRRWEMNVLRTGLSPPGGDLRRFFSTQVAWALVARLPGTPVGFFVADGALRHPPRHERAGATIGHVVDASLEHDRLLASFALAPTAAVVDAWLHALERLGRLRELGASLALSGTQWRDRFIMHQPAAELIGFEAIEAVDLVMRPAAEDACVLRSL